MCVCVWGSVGENDGRVRKKGGRERGKEGEREIGKEGGREERKRRNK